MPLRWGYTLSSEEHPPGALVAAAVNAEQADFDFCSISDHFHPWIEAQGHSPFAWAVLGAIAARTETIELMTGVTCPTVRLHPAIVAQAAATTALLSEGRFSLGLGSGEALNEHILGHRWPPPETRLAMLEEATEVIRRLWSGETVDHRGTFYAVENARLFDVPDRPVPIVMSGFGKRSAQLAGRIGDGFFGHQTTTELTDAYRSVGGHGPRYAQIDVCLGPDRAACRRTVHETWPNGALPGQLAQELPTWTQFEQAAQLVSEDAAAADVPCGPDVDAVVRLARDYVRAGYDHLYLHQIGPDQDALLDAWRSDLGAGLRGLESDLVATG